MRVCVFTGSSHGARPAYASAARELGALLAGRGIGVVYGGGHVGLMGELAQAALDAGGEVIGVIPMRSWSARSRCSRSPSCASSPPCTSARR